MREALLLKSQIIDLMNFINTCCVLFLGMTLFSCRSTNDPDAGSITYGEPYRPAFHFSPPSGWMNDPNGMVFHDGEYHLFYQHYPDSTVWGPMHWGHAVSKDMVHWENLPIALYPDSLGYIFSGSAVVDKENTAGFGTLEKPALVAMFTYHDPAGEKAGRIDFQTQGIAFSTDNGRSWTKYAGNPVIPNPGIRDFRDPKLIWDAQRNSWLLTLAVADHVEFYRSADLKSWKKLSEFGKAIGNHGGVWECPDFFPMEDDRGDNQWVLLSSINPGGPQGGSATQYFIGSFDGTTFTSQDTVTRWIDHGADNYAGVTWSGIPETDGRRLFLGWMSNWQYAQVVPTGVWRSAMTLPRELRLARRDGVFSLDVVPAREVGSLMGTPSAANGSATLTGEKNRIDFSPEGRSFALTFSNDKGEQLMIVSGSGTVFIDRTRSGRSVVHPAFGAIHRMPADGIGVDEVTVYLDRSSVEVFINQRSVMTDLVFPTVPYNKVVLDGGEASAFTLTPLKDIWKTTN